MNAILQCLIHISELSTYFLYEYPKDKATLNFKNKYIPSRGTMSEAYYEIIKEINKISENKSAFRYNSYSLYSSYNSYGSYSSYNSYAPYDFKKTLGRNNSQFSRYEANDSKDLILYLLQTFHEELNYFGDQVIPGNIALPNQSFREYTFNYFCTTYNIKNFSKISQLFYGTYENVVKCDKCKISFYSYQKFEFISLSTYKYRYRSFNIMDGFEDFVQINKLKGNNQYYCKKCRKLVDAEIYTKIIQPPLKLVLNIDYGKNKINDVDKLIFNQYIDITKFMVPDYGKSVQYRLCAVCTHIGASGSGGHYVAFCRNNENGNWYKFNDSSCSISDGYSLSNNSPYILIYELIL